MWNYFGAKTRVVRLYPPPLPGLPVIEPFCGAAAYSLYHDWPDVLLNDISPAVVGAWHYLQAVTPERMGEVFNEDRWPAGSNLRAAGLSQAERDLMRWQSQFGAVAPSHAHRSKWATSRRRLDALRRKWHRYRQTITGWTVTRGTYAEMPDIRATWFVDPPYQYARCKYPYDCVTDYGRLAEWCRSRKGRVIVCGGLGDGWLPFERLGVTRACNGMNYPEFVWWQDND